MSGVDLRLFSVGRLGDLFAASWGVLGMSWGVLGASWERLGASWGVLEACWGFLEASWGRLAAFRVVLGRLGGILDGFRDGKWMQVGTKTDQKCMPTWKCNFLKKPCFSLREKKAL